MLDYPIIEPSPFPEGSYNKALVVPADASYIALALRAWNRAPEYRCKPSCRECADFKKTGDYHFALYPSGTIEAGCRLFTIAEYREHIRTYSYPAKAKATSEILDYFEGVLATHTASNQGVHTND